MSSSILQVGECCEPIDSLRVPVLQQPTCCGLPFSYADHVSLCWTPDLHYCRINRLAALRSCEFIKIVGSMTCMTSLYRYCDVTLKRPSDLFSPSHGYDKLQRTTPSITKDRHEVLLCDAWCVIEAFVASLGTPSGLGWWIRGATV